MLVEVKILHPEWRGGNIAVFREVTLPPRPKSKRYVNQWREYRNAIRRQIYAKKHPLVLDAKIRRKKTVVKVLAGTMLRVSIRQWTRRGKKRSPFWKRIKAPGTLYAPAWPDFAWKLMGGK